MSVHAATNAGISWGLHYGSGQSERISQQVKSVRHKVEWGCDPCLKMKELKRY